MGTPGIIQLPLSLASQITSKIVAETREKRNEQTLVAPDIDRDDKVHSVKIKASWLYHGAISGALSVVSIFFTNKLILHHWVEIKVTGNKWYTLQMSKFKELRMNAHSSEKEAN